VKRIKGVAVSMNNGRGVKVPVNVAGVPKRVLVGVTPARVGVFVKVGVGSVGVIVAVLVGVPGAADVL
jgi:hypothetical protein